LESLVNGKWVPVGAGHIIRADDVLRVRAPAQSGEAGAKLAGLLGNLLGQLKRRKK
jgi:hypothetical protein